MKYHALHWGLWLSTVIIVALVLFVFEIWMIVDAALNKKIRDKTKAWWIVGMMLIHPFVAIVYFFTDHQKR